MEKNIKGFLEDLFEYYFSNINFFSNLKFEYTVSTTLKYCYKKALNKKLKLMGEVMKYFYEKITGP